MSRAYFSALRDRVPASAPRALGAWLLVAMFLLRPALGAPRDIFLIKGQPPTSFEILDPASRVAAGAGASDMLARVAGSWGVVEGDDARRLPSIALEAARATDPGILSARVRMVLRVRALRGERDVEILLAPDGRAAARHRESPDALATIVWVDRAALARTLRATGHYAGAIMPEATPSANGDLEPAPHEDDGGPAAGEVFELARPLTPGWEMMTSRVLAQRMFQGMNAFIRGSERDLSRETLLCRLPKGYDPRRPAGLLVWIDPGDLGDPPVHLHAAADAMNMVIVGARDASNDRVVVDRMQLAFDGVATVCDRFHIDESRIYLTGMSGGGRVSSMLWAAFPDVFAGAVAIVGLNHYREVTISGEKLAAGFSRPRGPQHKALQTRRLAAMTGPIDFNYEEIRVRARQLIDDGLTVRLFDYPDMGHTMPTPERFYDALSWVDEPHRQARDEAIDRATRAMDEFRQRFGESGPLPEAGAELLRDITRIAPWSEPAWEAAAILDQRGTR